MIDIEEIKNKTFDNYDTAKDVYIVDTFDAGEILKALELQQAEIELLKGLVREVAHIGVDFGYGAFELDESHILLARKLLSIED